MTLVLLPGMDGSGSLFADFVSALETNAVVISYPPDLPMGYSELEAFVRGSLPDGSPFMLLGESFSGPVAIVLASSGLAGLQAIVLVCSFAKYPGSEFLRFCGRLPVPFWRLPIQLVSFVLLGRFSSSSLRLRLLDAMRRVAPSVWNVRLRAALEVDVTRRLSQISVPLLYLRASEDRVVSPSASALVLRHCPKAKVAALEGPHFLLQAKPREAAAAIRAFAHESGIAL